MSRSDNTPWRAGRPYDPHWMWWGLPRGTGRYLRRQWNKRQRQREHAALRDGVEPEPARSRHSVLYDYW